MSSPLSVAPDPLHPTVAEHGLDGLLLATLLSGLILVAVGLLRLGTFIKYIPFPVTVGFTTGIATIIFASQVKELLGLTLEGREPGPLLPKLVALGEYAVLDGAPAVVLALDRYAEAAIEQSNDALCRLTMRAGGVEELAFPPGTPSGAALVDLVAAAQPQLRWSAVIDSQAFFEGAAKLGLGSSAAVSCAYSAW